MTGTTSQSQESRSRNTPAAKKHYGFFVLLLLIGIALGTGIAYELSQRKAQEHALAASVVEIAV
jgi:hypothetical protein